MGDTKHEITGVIRNNNDVWSYASHEDHWIARIFADLFAAAEAASPEAKAMDHAISALHGQHTRNGRPLRYMPELE